MWVVGGVGAVILGAAVLERRLVKKGKYMEAELFNSIVGGVLASGVVCAAAWFIMHAVRRFIL
ncbi:hypothetical protein LRR81_08620 [Metabacillus sp. GX 13764]|uniref:hypothetical protein n=1 Tax=Metabacillus kandeliae TaxID=2900151 RepID=UPI001E2B605F|nr:hypothetical protein [Metabacillus kandeliae]MCD7034296.1 hypothetical protein [Metabacillus kandeliae]